MKRVYQSSDYYSAQLVKSHLQDNDIEATVTGELLLGAIGEIPANSYPSVWVTDDQDYERARQLIEEFELGKSGLQADDVSWTCPQCGERIEPQFNQCWNCGATRPVSNPN